MIVRFAWLPAVLVISLMSVGNVFAQEAQTAGDAVEEVESLQEYLPEESQASAEQDTVEVPEEVSEAGGPDDGEPKKASDKADDLAERLKDRSVESEAESRAAKKSVESDQAKEIIEGVVENQAESTEDIEQNDADIMALDVSNSIDDAVNQAGYLKWGGDLRTGYYWSKDEFADGLDDDDDDIRARFRLEGQWNVTDNFRLTSRLAYLCSTASCDPNTTVKTDRIDGNSIEGGTATIDEFYLHWFRTERFNLALGRMQTRFVSRGGVYAKSLDRNNSHNANINWTDGVHINFNPGYGRGWRLNWISEYNNEDQTSSVRRDPLDFSTNDSKYSHFVALENNQRWGYIIQRGLDISYMPDALLVDGDINGRREDYWGVVARTAARIPLGQGLQRLQIGTEIGYAPETPTRESADSFAVGDTSDLDGFAWNATVSVMDFLPDQSIGVLYGRTDPGWLISPQYASNEEQIELRYVWRPDANIMLDARIRHREPLKNLAGFSDRDSTTDIFLRATIRYSVDNLLDVIPFGGVFQ